MGFELNNDQIIASCKLEKWWKRRDEQVIGLGGGPGTGKAQPIDTLIPTPEGMRRLGDLKVGDKVFNCHGKPTTVLGVYDQGFLDAYKITFTDNTSSICNDEHLWKFYDECHKKEHVGTLREMMGMPLHYFLESMVVRSRISIPLTEAVEYPERELPIDPYALATIISAGDELYEALKTSHPNIHNHCSQIVENGIPMEYMISSIEQRKALLNGLFDMNAETAVSDDGRFVNIYYWAPTQQVATSVKSILDSLGIVCDFCYSTTDPHKRYGVMVSPTEDKLSFFFTSKHQIRENLPFEHDSLELLPLENNRRYVHCISKLKYKVEMRCIYVDNPEHLYLTNDYIVTHNTSTIMNFIDRLGLAMDEVLFVTYMGKAVSRMIQAGLPAKTIHATCYNYEKKERRDENEEIIYDSYGKPKMQWVPILKDHLPKKIRLIVADEAYTIPEKNALDLISFGVPIIAIGDPNQLDPPFGKPYFLKDHIDIMLYQIMRQAEGDPIVYLAQKVLNRDHIPFGDYGSSSVIKKENLTDFAMRHADIILTTTNKLRGSINNLFRESFMRFSDLSIPHVGDKVICRANDWSKSVTIGGSEIYLTNGTTGTIDWIDKRSYTTKGIKADFQPDFGTRPFRNLKVDLTRLNAPLGQAQDAWSPPDMNTFEYAYAITCYSSQGSQFDNVLILDEGVKFSLDAYYKSLYVAITRAVKSVTLVR